MISFFFADFMASKPENVKFVQDTSKFWYKPDISRDQGNNIRSSVGLSWIRSHVKGIVHPKMKMLSSFPHPHVVPNLYIFLYVEHKIRYFEEPYSCWSPLTCIVREINILDYGSQWGASTVWLPTFFKVFFIFNMRKSHTGLEWHEDESIMTKL